MKDIFALLKQGSMAALTAAIVNFVLAGLKGLAFIYGKRYHVRRNDALSRRCH